MRETISYFSLPMKLNHLLLLLLLIKILSLISTSSSLNFTFNTFNSSSLLFFGNSSLESNVISLTNHSSFSIGRVLYPSKIPTKLPNSTQILPFSTSFIFSIARYKDTLPGHGLVFIFSPSIGIEGTSSAQHLGLFNRTNDGDPSNHVFGIEFDLFMNPEFNDIDDNHVGVDVNSLSSFTAQSAGFWPDDGSDFDELSLNNGVNYQVWIDYLNSQLTVTMARAGVKRPKKPLINVTLDLSEVLLDEMYVGFCAATGRLVESHRILSWSFSNSNSSVSGDWLITSNLPSFIPPKSSVFRSKGFIAGITILIVFLMSCGVGISLFWVKRKRRRKREREDMEEWELEYWPHRINYQEIYESTKGFSEENVIGFGGNGKVYKGVMGGVEVAVKRFSHKNEEGMREFLAEISSLGRLKHRNLVGLRGWCKRDKGSLILVYDFMENGSLDKRVFECEACLILGWEDRVRVLKDVASGVLYLHEGWEARVLHRDIKASNVLIDKDMNGRLGDFGLARMHGHGQAMSTTRVVGTVGYMAPEVVRSGRASVQTDVFGFGILILEVVCGRRPIEDGKPPLVDWVWGLMEKGELVCALDERLRVTGGFDNDEVERLLHLGLLCAYPDPKARPTMRQVVKVLEGTSNANESALLSPLSNLRMAHTTTILHHHHHHHNLLSSLAPSHSFPLLSSTYRTLHLSKPLSSFSLSLSSPSNGVSHKPHVSTAEVDYAPIPDFDFQKEIARLRVLRSKLSNSKNLNEKLRVLNSDSRVKLFFSIKNGFSRVLSSLNLDLSEVFLIKCLVSAGQEHVLSSELDLVDREFGSKRSSLRTALYALAEMVENWELSGRGGEMERRKRDGVLVALKNLLRMLGEIEQFYDCIGGIIGYQITVLELMYPSKSEVQKSMSWSAHLDDSTKCQILEIYVPSGLDLSQNIEYASQAALWGIEGLPELGEIYPLGGSADRLSLVDPDTGECLPAAMLPYCGRTLLEGLIRDLQAREFLYFKIYGKQCITPVAIMTSSAKNNHERITSLCEKLGWFGRGQSSFQLFEQPLVPTVAAGDGQWLVGKPFTPVCKPGGHGVIWKLAYDKGIFQWFYSHRRKGATVRQVSNVVAATDLTLLALAGIGLRHGKKLGFASCKRKLGATEGSNVLIEKKNLDGKWAYGLSCIEYTEFDKFGITDGPISPLSLQAEFPANTNILYIDLAAAEKVASSKNATCLPGMVLNLKKPIVYVDHLGIQHSVPGGRLECTMQNIADNFMNTYSSRCYKGVEDALDTFIVYNERKRVTSSAKRKGRHTDTSLHQTPDGALLDIIRNASDLLSHCDIKIPKIEDNDKYFHSGPPFLILLHPALGPLWEVTRQKFYGGSISEGSELQIEVAEFLWRNVQLDGSLIIVADNIMGSTRIDENEEPILQYGHRCGRCKLQNVKVLNRGIDWNSAENIYWKHDVQRSETVKIILHGNAEFEATDVVLQGNHVFEVPNGYKLLITTGNSGLSVKLDAIGKKMKDRGSWFWKYKLQGTHVQLEMVESE